VSGFVVWSINKLAGVGQLESLLFPFAEYWWFYLAFTGFVLFMLALDLGVFHKHAHEVKFKEALGWSVFWVSLGLTFNALLYIYTRNKFGEEIAARTGLEFLTGFVIEKSLSVDNIFIFVVIFTYFAIPLKYQHRVLFYGIIGALVFRALFISIGSILMQYKLVVIIFGVFLILTGAKLFFTPDKEIRPEDNLLIKWLKKILPIKPRIEGQAFFIRENGKLFGTPLLVALVFIEFTDIIFAVDSVPAIFAITKEPLIVFTSNVFAILGLRALYFLMAGIVDKFHLLKYGLGLVLIFVGAKMVYLNELFGGKFPIGLSLSIITLFIGGSVVASFLFPKKK
jgi:tellurite resistance protein TerC